MVEQFLNHIQRHNLCKTSDKILLAVSGGIDSMVMLHLFLQAGINVGVAHCNFRLRANQSDADEAFVRKACSSFKIPVHCAAFETAEVAATEKKSIQVAARDLRYRFFKDVAVAHGYDYIATAHHLDDSLETVIINLIRGTGLAGLQGIQRKNGKIIRPMMFASRDMIQSYAESLQITWREDASNADEDYQRNFVRLQIMPKLKELNENLSLSFIDTQERIEGAYSLFAGNLKNIKNEITSFDGEQLIIRREPLTTLPHSTVVLWELIKEYGFNFVTCKAILDTHQAGKVFLSDRFRLTIDRGKFIIDRINDLQSISVVIDDIKQTVVSNGISLNLTYVDVKDFTLIKSDTLAQLDADLVRFPLKWRAWQPGDTIRPLGMQGEKKLSDLFIDCKISRPEKDKMTVLESDGKIVWIIGFRISDYFKVTDKTRRVLQIKVAKG